MMFNNAPQDPVVSRVMIKEFEGVAVDNEYIYVNYLGFAEDPPTYILIGIDDLDSQPNKTVT